MFFISIKGLFILKLFKYLSLVFWSTWKMLDKKAKINFKFMAPSPWKKKYYNTHVDQYLQKKMQFVFLKTLHIR